MLSVDKTNAVLQVWQVRPLLHLSQYLIHCWQYLTPFDATPKKVPVAQVHVPFPLLVA